MKICGLQKTTLLDFPGRVAATVFLGGCNFRCPFCHNTDLLGGDAPELMSVDQLLTFLKRRSGILEGVCITGGEPTLHGEELICLIRSIKALGYQVKLDTNGSHPQLLRQLKEDGLLDYIAMDIKAGRFQYPRICGTPGLAIAPVEESIRLLMEGHMPYEFRTTVVNGLHSAEDFRDIAQWIRGCSRYFLQGFVDSGNVLESGFSAFSKKELKKFLDIVKPFIPTAEIRGLDY